MNHMGGKWDFQKHCLSGHWKMNTSKVTLRNVKLFLNNKWKENNNWHHFLLCTFLRVPGRCIFCLSFHQLPSDIALIKNNARVGSRIAVALSRIQRAQEGRDGSPRNEKISPVPRPVSGLCCWGHFFLNGGYLSVRKTRRCTQTVQMQHLFFLGCSMFAWKPLSLLCQTRRRMEQVDLG